jgi:hypothetical protein
VNEEAALQEWQNTRTGPFAEWYQVGRRILWSKLAKSSPLLRKYGDPASGPLSPNFEITLGVSSVPFEVAVS